ncbi:MAG TPA: imidazole glycerol phosphate synthase subunit HisH [Gemmatimonadaceae bacterium]|nr:imidazole glycerol phosphate synthase subunit HisH [Gemmatimonadaceae bacterium]
MRVTVFDYGAGNLHSLIKALDRAPGVSIRVDTDAARASDTDALVLPGVGAFGEAAARLAPGRDTLIEAIAGGLPVLGICLGMQLLFDASDEGGGDGLGVLPGRVTALSASRVPQIGWNSLDEANDPLVLRSSLTTAYYANGFVCRPIELSCVRAWSEHGGDRFPAIVRQERVVGTQFHPEKSSQPGVALLHAFLDEARR